MKMNKLVIVLGVLFTPVIISGIILIPTGINADNDWIGFYGSYSGGLIGGAVAYFVAYMQGKTNIEINKQNLEIEKSRIEAQLKNEIEMNNSRMEAEKNRIDIQIEHERNQFEEKLDAEKDLIEKQLKRKSLPTLVALRVDIDIYLSDVKNGTTTMNSLPPGFPIDKKYLMKFSIRNIVGIHWESFENLMDIDLISELIEFRDYYRLKIKSLNYDLARVAIKIDEMKSNIDRLTHPNMNADTQREINKFRNTMQDSMIEYDVEASNKKASILELESEELLTQVSELKRRLLAK